MKLRLKSNGNEMEVKKSDFEKFTPEMKRNYDIVDHKDAEDVPVSTTTDTTAKVEGKGGDKKPVAPATGDKTDDTKK